MLQFVRPLCSSVRSLVMAVVTVDRCLAFPENLGNGCVHFNLDGCQNVVLLSVTLNGNAVISNLSVSAQGNHALIPCGRCTNRINSIA